MMTSMSPEMLKSLANDVAQMVIDRLEKKEAMQAAEAEQAQAPREPLPEEREALQRAYKLVDSILSARRMTAEERAELHRLFGAASQGEEIFELRRRLAVAVNRDELDLPSGGGHPLP
jgi:hypothetical protein